MADRDTVEVPLPMGIALEPTPDAPAVQAVLYGAVVLAGEHGERSGFPCRAWTTALSSKRPPTSLAFTAPRRRRGVTPLPIARTHHTHSTVYWRTEGGNEAFGISNIILHAESRC